MGNKTLDDIFNELEEKYSGNRETTKKTKRARKS